MFPNINLNMVIECSICVKDTSELYYSCPCDNITCVDCLNNTVLYYDKIACPVCFNHLKLGLEPIMKHINYPTPSYEEIMVAIILKEIQILDLTYKKCVNLISKTTDDRSTKLLKFDKLLNSFITKTLYDEVVSEIEQNYEKQKELYQQECILIKNKKEAFFKRIIKETNFCLICDIKIPNTATTAAKDVPEHICKELDSFMNITQNFKQCPDCYMFIEKKGGCNEMVCRCGAVFDFSKERFIKVQYNGGIKQQIIYYKIFKLHKSVKSDHCKQKQLRKWYQKLYEYKLENHEIFLFNKTTNLFKLYVSYPKVYAAEHDFSDQKLFPSRGPPLFNTIPLNYEEKAYLKFETSDDFWHNSNTLAKMVREENDIPEKATLMIELYNLNSINWLFIKSLRSRKTYTTTTLSYLLDIYDKTNIQPFSIWHSFFKKINNNSNLSNQELPLFAMT